MTAGDRALEKQPVNRRFWALVDVAGMPIRLVSRRYVAQKSAGASGVPMIGGGGTEELFFVVSGKASYARATYLKFLLRPFDKGIKDARLWEIKVNVPAS